MKTILVLMDSLNRHMLNIYNKDTWVKAPNISRLAEKSVVFDNHWLGSAPCMPARRDILTGRLNFLERNWGPIEPYDITLPETLRKHGIFTHITTDHPHYFELGGEGYCQLFNTWDYQRGQEIDPWVSRVRQPEMPEQYYGKVFEQYELNRSKLIKEEDFSTPRTIDSACQWLEENKDAENYFLMVECFDPHEPFDCTREYLDMYDDDYKGPRYDWSNYAPVNEPVEAIGHLKKRYAGSLTMADKALGRFLNVLDKYNIWEDALLIFTTDHGHLLGEHGWTGKNFMHAYNEIAHIPFIVHLPGSKRAGDRVSALTQNIDLMPTILDYYNIPCPDSVRGYSLRGVLESREEKVRDIAIYGWHGKTVNITDGKYTYFRAPASEDNCPCYAYCTIPTTLWSYMGKKVADKIEAGRFLKYTNYPVFKIPVGITTNAYPHFEKTQALLGGNVLKHVRESLLFDIEADYGQEHPINDENVERMMTEKLKTALHDADSPEEQFERLGLK